MQNRTPDTQPNNVSQKTPVAGMDKNNKRAEGMDDDRELQGRNRDGQGDRSKSGGEPGKGQDSTNSQQRQ